MILRPLVKLVPRSRFAVALLLGGVALLSQFASTGQSQAPAPTDPRLLAAVSSLAGQLKTQQDAMVANQTKIEAQTAMLKEELRLLRIYSARGGSSLRH